MTIDEAVEIHRKQPHEVSISDSIQARFTLADAYLRLTDPTPLTVELIEKELGPSNTEGEWRVGGRGIYWGSSAAYCCTIKITTICDLRQVVRMLRGGV